MATCAPVPAAPVRPRHVTVEGLAGVGKTAVAHRLAALWGYRALPEPAADNPFLEPFFKDRARYALQAQLFSLLARHQLLTGLTQGDLFTHGTVTDVLFERDRLQATLHLSVEELALYDRVHAVVRERVPRPDLVIYLQARPDVVAERLRGRRMPLGGVPPGALLEDWARTYNDFFFHYDRTPLLVVNTNDVDLTRDDEALRLLATEALRPRGGTRHYNPAPLP